LHILKIMPIWRFYKRSGAKDEIMPTPAVSRVRAGGPQTTFHSEQGPADAGWQRKKTGGGSARAPVRL